MMTHDSLMELTKDLPMKQIDVNGAGYLQRYFVGEDAGGQTWLHRFLTADAERHVHSHPWVGTSMILCGKYTEHLRKRTGLPHMPFTDRTRYFAPGEVNQIWPETLHRIIEVEPDTWTLLHIKPGRQPTWSFFDDGGNEIVMQSSPEDWHKNFGVRQ